MGEDEIAVGSGGLEGHGGVDGAKAGVSDCEETVRRLYHFLDGALTDERRTAIRAHLDSCGDCFEALGFETELRRVIADRCREHVPDALKGRIAAAIEREAAGAGKDGRPRAGAGPA